MKQAEVLPLKTLDAVLNWVPDQDLKFKTEALRVRIRDESGPKLLICHDMQGGYLEDRFVTGSSKCEGYRFFHWNYVDTFVYFSHHLVTIPPIGWINAAHRHGVKVLGTVITEWDNGFETCSNLLGCPTKCDTFVKRLCDICKHFGFDGWLINIENKLEENNVPKMAELVFSLKTALQESVPGSEVIWYDSVIKSGALKWQNELNDLNRMFFDACDGIFLNYNWKEEHLQRSQSLAGRRRASDVYVGVDVFGRGCLGGGGFNTSEALDVINRFELSVALFAPGWVLEVNGWENFTDNQYKFWKLIGKFLRSSVYCSLPISTSFCQGYGTNSFKRGQCIKECPWYDLSCQQLQPTFECQKDDSQCKAVIFSEDGFHGGGCLKITGALTPLAQSQELILFRTKVEPVDTWLATATWKASAGTEVDLQLVLTFRNPQGHEFCCVLPCSIDHSHGTDNMLHPSAMDRLLPALTSRQKEEQGLADCYADELNSWSTKVFLLKKEDFAEHLLTGISIRISKTMDTKRNKQEPFSLLLGQIQIVLLSDAKSGQEPAPTKL